MKRYIDADRLREKIIDRLDLFKELSSDTISPIRIDECKQIIDIIDSLQQEQPKDVSSEIAEYFGEDIPFEDERTKAAYHFFSAGKAFELREYEEERKKHITDLLDNFQKGMNAGYEKAISELKEGKVECSPVMKELIDKLFGIGNTFNFGFGPKTLQQEQPKDVSSEIAEYFGEDIPFEDERTKAAYHFFSQGRVFELKEIEEERKRHIKSLIDNYEKGMKAGYEKAIKDSKLECSPVMEQFIGKLFEIGSGFGPTNFQQEQPEVDLEQETKRWWKEHLHLNPENKLWMDAHQSVVFARHFFALGLNARKEDDK